MYSQNPLGLSSKTLPSPQLDFLYLFCLPALPTSSNRLSRMMEGGWLLARIGTEFSCALTFHLSLRLWPDHSSGFTYCDFSQVTSVSSQLCKAPWPQISLHLEPPRFQSPKLLFTSLLAASHDDAPTVYPSLPVYHLTHFLTKPAFRSHLSRIKWPEVKQYIKLQLVSVLDTDFLPDKQLHS